MHTTAHTIKPSFEIIKTVPGGLDRLERVPHVPRRPGARLRRLRGQPGARPRSSSPTSRSRRPPPPRSSAIEPRIAMLSYSTGASGTGADVDKVRTATELVRERRPELNVEGPIQYDAAVDASVARTKLPDSEVAGRATVFVFPDLNTGNNTYKAVQRSAGAVAVGPVLQGLRKPVNDLSRGALVAGHRQHRRDHRDPGPGARPGDGRRVRRRRHPDRPGGHRMSLVPGIGDRPGAHSALGAHGSVLVINSGSSSLKYQLVDPVGGEAIASGTGRADRRGRRRPSRHTLRGQRRRERTGRIADHGEALRTALELFARGRAGPRRGPAWSPSGTGWCTAATRSPPRPWSTTTSCAAIADLSPLAPLHNPANLRGIEVARAAAAGRAARRGVRHRVLPHAARGGVDVRARPGGRRAARDPPVRVPRHVAPVRRPARSARVLGRRLEDLNQIVLHLGNGASASAVRGGVAVETSMGLTPLEGLVMGTRTGDIDPAVVFHLYRNAGMSSTRSTSCSTAGPGSRGCPGENDFREIRRLIGEGDAGARLAMDVYLHRLRKYIGAYLARARPGRRRHLHRRRR